MSGKKGSYSKKNRKVSTPAKKRLQLEGPGEYQSKLSSLLDEYC